MQAQAVILAFALGPLVAAGTARAQTKVAATDAELFEKVFARPAQASQRVPLPIRIDGEAKGEIIAELEGGDVHRLSRTALMLALDGNLRQELVELLAEDGNSGGWVDAEDIERRGLKLRYDPSSLEIDIVIPPSLRYELVHLGMGLPDEAADAIRPADVSAYLNLRGGQAVEWTTEGDADNRPVQLSTDSAINLHDWVLEGSAQADGADNWRRGDVRLIRDLPTEAVRLTAGDHAVPVSGFQPSFPLLGIGGARNFSLQPYVNTRPTGRFSFVLERPAEVTVLINQVPVRTLHLAAGRHDVRDLALSAGVNDVQVVAKDDLGEIRTFSFTMATAGDLLADGVSSFAVGGGFPLIDSRGFRSYDWERPALYASYQRGLTSWLTTAAHAVGDRFVRVGGTRTTAATPVGSFAAEALGSQRVTEDRYDPHDYGYAGGLRYGFARAARGTAITTSVSLAWEHRSPDFTVLGHSGDQALYRDDFTVSLSQSLGWKVLATATGRHRIGHEPGHRAQSAGVTLARPFGAGFSVSLAVNATRHTGQADAVEGFLSIHRIIPDKRQALLSSGRAHSENGARGQLTWTRTGQLGDGRLATTATANGSDQARSAQGSAEYTGHRMTASLSHIATDTDVASQTTQTTAAAFGTALVMADGTWAVSRPVSGSFAIVAPNATLDGQDAEINPGPLGPLAQADRFGPAVVSNLQPYTVGKLNLEAPTLPVGYSLGESRYWVLPSYKSGTLIRYGEAGAISVRGTLLGADGQPLALASGTVESVADGTETVFFTNRAGRFALEAMKAGRYRLRLLDGTAPLEFAIPASAVGSYAVGDLRLGATHTAAR